MGFSLSAEAMNRALAALGAEYTVYAPKVFEEGANFSGLDLVRYGKISAIEEVVFDKKSVNSCKEAFYPPSETLFYFTENAVKESAIPLKKPLVFVRSCDIHALKRLDDVLIENGAPDYFYERIRKNACFVLMPCKTVFDSCFCVDMKTNTTDDYDMSVEWDGACYRVNCKAGHLCSIFKNHAENEIEVNVPFVSQTKVHVMISNEITNTAAMLPLWDEYDGRCINCGRCTFGCPSCTCWTMQDMFYTENGKAGERRRVWASCMVDGFTDLAGGGSYRKKNGERMRFKVLHKIYNHKKRFGRTMCVGCGRCDDVCPEYISFSNTINTLSAAAGHSRAKGCL
ncbi:MAG: anaerobic sulfite reductase subunit AsrA [Treponema sp.]|jgi:anaerobic sulfite reductase subunit A|nr:anaerobic sulfite reductase subunit AsrA [Treponema sp.]